MRRFSMTGEQLPLVWISVIMSAWGNSPHRRASTFSPPRTPVSQSWIIATRGTFALTVIDGDCSGKTVRPEDRGTGRTEQQNVEQGISNVEVTDAEGSSLQI